jgi:putative acetyltransferase
MRDVTVREANKTDLDLVATLVDEYEDWLVANRLVPTHEGNEFRGSAFPPMYSRPSGCVLIAVVDEEAAGCVAMRPLDGARICEMKKLYVRPQYRSSGAGRALVTHLLAHARAAGYDVMRLDTLPRMTDAIRMYERFGFRRRGPYHAEHPVGALYFENQLERLNADSTDT